MKIRYFIFISFIVWNFPNIHAQTNSTNLSSKTKTFSVVDSVITTKICTEIVTPFKDKNRKSFSAIRMRKTSRYGEFRSSYKPGHLHAGIDLKGDFNESIYPIGNGQVTKIYHFFPHKSIIIKHTCPNNTTFYSIYTHLEDICVEEGNWVNTKTKLARLFNEEELKRSDFGTANHLHLEIRKSYDDNGRASYASMTQKALDKFCYDPEKFFRKNLK